MCVIVCVCVCVCVCVYLYMAIVKRVVLISVDALYKSPLLLLLLDMNFATSRHGRYQAGRGTRDIKQDEVRAISSRTKHVRDA